MEIFQGVAIRLQREYYESVYIPPPQAEVYKHNFIKFLGPKGMRNKMFDKKFSIKKMPCLTGLFSLTMVLALLLAVVSGCAPAKAPAAASETVQPQAIAPEAKKAVKELVIKVLDVGQGDAILIRAPGETVLIDTGDIPARDKLMAHLAQEKISSLDKVIITHPHADHLGGLPKMLEKIKVKQIYDSGQAATSNLYKQYLTMVSKEKIPFKLAVDGDVIDLGDGISLKILSPRKPLFSGTESDINNNSIVAKLVYKEFSMLFTGDAEKESEEALVKKHGKTLKSTILKSPHHGSRSSSTSPFLKGVSPEATIISLGEDNSYHHPHPSTLKRYKDNKIKIYRTDTDGTVTVTSDGKSYNIVKEK